MRITKVTWGRSKSANYQGQRCEVTVEINKGESYEAALALAQARVDVALGDGPTDAEIAHAQAVVAKAKVLGKL